MQKKPKKNVQELFEEKECQTVLKIQQQNKKQQKYRKKKFVNNPINNRNRNRFVWLLY